MNLRHSVVEQRAILSANGIYCGDARDLIPGIEQETVACSVWSPPYFVGKSYEDYLETYEQWCELIREVLALHYKIIRPGGFVVINVADILCFADPRMPRYQAENLSQRRSAVTREDILRALQDTPNLNRYELAEILGCSEQTIDRRLNGNNIRGGKYATQTRVKLAGGGIEEWASEAGFYMYDRRVWVKDPTWHNSEWHSSSYRSVDEFEYLYFLWKPGATLVDRAKLSPQEWAEWGSRGVWCIPSVRANDDHEAKFPVALPRRIIRLLTAPGDLVLDCFVGSGSSAVAAIYEGRRYIGIELCTEYVALATKNCLLASQSMQTALVDQGESPGRARQLRL